jgi:hypothetical protein
MDSNLTINTNSTGRWHVEYDREDRTTVKLTFNNKKQAQKYADKYFKSQDPESNPPWVYESPPPSPTNQPLNNFLENAPKTANERKKRLAGLIEVWNKEYSN